MDSRVATCGLWLLEDRAMKRLLCLTAGSALVATAAFAQFPPGFEPMPLNPVGTEVYFRDTSGTDANAAGLVDLITRLIDRSRSLHLVPIKHDDTLELDAPISIVKDGDSRRVIVTYEVTPQNGGIPRSYKTTCTSTQLDRCAAAIAQRVEQIARENEHEG
jgi:hypothetical protein